MVLPTGNVQINFSDDEVNQFLRTPGGEDGRYTVHFSQNEELFVRFAEPFEVASFPVHHDLGDPEPHPRQRDAVRSLVRQIHERSGSVLGGLAHLFDVSANQRPSFFRLYKLGDIRVLYLTRIDLTYRPSRCELVERTTNAETARYRTRDLFLEADLYPLAELAADRGRIQKIRLEQPVSDTWIGETGRGYMRAGMWLDRDLTKFFSRLFVPEGVQTYPYFPFTCKYRTVSHSILDLSEDGRRRSAQLLRRAREFLLPHLREIENSLRNVENNGFTERLTSFVRLKREVKPDWENVWNDFKIDMYLNEAEEREFEVVRGI